MRYFSNLYGQIQITKRFGLLAGFDLGIQQQNKGSSRYDLWFTPTIIGHYLLNTQWRTALRLEYYSDPQGVMIPVEPPEGFRTAGISWNLDYIPVSRVACRLETRLLGSQDPVLRSENGLRDSDFFIAVSIAVKLGTPLAR